ncbi:hypothetical protein GCM10023085_59410 [Actinomadura viridis]|uniref:Uncharacterized protein n=1 Tax=Actinomadura viridis TaxID=58110 RepID=A0A931DNL9_9ACTN|nr:hypothetical protein [Actinomadura viridis]MBG6093265.1 hypothetical protein [Actinomadura viridis]
MGDLPPRGGQGAPAPYELPGPPPAPLVDGKILPPRPTYARWTREALIYLPVVLGEEPIGHLWASKYHPAAGFLVRPGPSTAALNASGIWEDRLAEAYEKGVPAPEAIRRWKGLPPDPQAGGVPGDAEEREAPNLSTLHATTAPSAPVPEGPFVQDGAFPDGTPVDRSEGWGPLAGVVPPTYSKETDAPVRYIPVTRRGTVLGYVWASVAGEAASYVGRRSAGRDAEVAAGLWAFRLSRCFAEGVPALEALRRCKAAPDDPLAGAIGHGAEERELPSLAALRELAHGEAAP